MPWNLLILPLAAGYYLITRSNYYKYFQQRLDRQRLIFDTILLAIGLSVATFAIRFILEFAFPLIVHSIYEFLPIKVPFFGTSLAIFILSILAVEVSNYVFFEDRDKEIQDAINNVGSELEKILNDSFSSNEMLEFTLDTNKVYIGFVKELPIPTTTNYIRIIPMLSGYRDSKKRLVFTTDYYSVYQEYIDEKLINEIDELKVDLIITLDNLVTVSYFSSETYGRFHSKDKYPEGKEENEGVAVNYE